MNADTAVFRDAEELGKCVGYFQKLNGDAKVVLMGHSTGGAHAAAAAGAAHSLRGTQELT